MSINNKKKQPIILIGRINKGKLPIGGETAKNQTLIKVLGKFRNVIGLDFYKNKKHPWIFFHALWVLLHYTKATFILSTSASNIYPLLRLLKFCGIKRNIIHWVIGGNFDNLVKKGRFQIGILNIAKWTIVQSNEMASDLQKCGLKNVIYVPNVRLIPYIPELKHVLDQREKAKITKFVYLSRIMKEKGVFEILHCAQQLNKNGFSKRYTIDFYGIIDSNIRQRFDSIIEELPNINYHGVLDLRQNEGYDTLASYHAMLFPTFHPSEGIAGVIIDAYIAGLPIIISNWRHNTEIVKDKETGIVIPVHDTNALYSVLIDILNHEIELKPLAEKTRNEIQKYNATSVINEFFINKLTS